MNATPAINPDFAKGARLGDAVELAASLGVCKNTVWNHVGARRIPAVRLGSVVRFHLPSVLRALGVKQVITALLLLLATSASAADWAGFVRAIHLVESSGRTTGHIIGDGGKSLGPLQVSRAAWQDSRVGGLYEDVADLAVATRVLRAYLQRYAPRALSAEDWFTCSRIWNGGPNGASKTATLAYWAKVEGKL
jgi:hypothetical protein